MNPLQPYGPKFVGGHLDVGRLVLVRDDDTTDSPPIWITPGTLANNGDGSCTLTISEE